MHREDPGKDGVSSLRRWNGKIEIGVECKSSSQGHKRQGLGIRGAGSQRRSSLEQYRDELREGRWPEAVITDGSLKGMLTNWPQGTKGMEVSHPSKRHRLGPEVLGQPCPDAGVETGIPVWTGSPGRETGGDDARLTGANTASRNKALVTQTTEAFILTKRVWMCFIEEHIEVVWASGTSIPA